MADEHPSPTQAEHAPSIPGAMGGNAAQNIGRSLFFVLLFVFIAFNALLAYQEAGGNFGQIKWIKIVYPTYIESIVQDLSRSMVAPPDSGTPSGAGSPATKPSIPSGGSSSSSTATSSRTEIPPTTGAEPSTSWFKSMWFIVPVIVLVMGLGTTLFLRARKKKGSGDEPSPVPTHPGEAEIRASELEADKAGKKAMDLGLRLRQLAKLNYENSQALLLSEEQLVTHAQSMCTQVMHEFQQLSKSADENALYKELVKATKHSTKELHKAVEDNLEAWGMNPGHIIIIITALDESLLKSEADFKKVFVENLIGAWTRKEEAVPLEDSLKKSLKLPDLIAKLLINIEYVIREALLQMEKTLENRKKSEEGLRVLFREEHKELADLIKLSDQLPPELKSEQLRALIAKFLSEESSQNAELTQQFEKALRLVAGMHRASKELAALLDVTAEYKQVIIQIKSGIDIEENVEAYAKFGKEFYEAVEMGQEFVKAWLTDLTAISQELLKEFQLLEKILATMRDIEATEAELERRGVHRASIPEIPMANGRKIPMLGLGTWEVQGPICIQSAAFALKIGYTHIVTAWAYQNHVDIAQAISKYDRKNLFITSKVWKENLHYNDVLEACDNALTELGTNYLDLYLIHWPNKNIPMEETFRAMKKLIDDGKIKGMA